MINAQELNPHEYSTTEEIQNNLDILLDKMNKVRVAYNVPMIVTSGLRSLEDQMRINPSATKSKHLYGQACDIQDLDGTLKQWCLDNDELLRAIGVWMESFASTSTWVHFQIVPYGSYKEGGSLQFIP